MVTTVNRWSSIRKVLQEVEERQELGELPFTCVYYKDGRLVGSYFCGGEEETFTLFINTDYSDSAIVVALIYQHCKFFNDSIEVYCLDQKGTDLYQEILPAHAISVDL